MATLSAEEKELIRSFEVIKSIPDGGKIMVVDGKIELDPTNSSMYQGLYRKLYGQNSNESLTAITDIYEKKLKEYLENLKANGHMQWVDNDSHILPKNLEICKGMLDVIKVVYERAEQSLEGVKRIVATYEKKAEFAAVFPTAKFQIVSMETFVKKIEAAIARAERSHISDVAFNSSLHTRKTRNDSQVTKE